MIILFLGAWATRQRALRDWSLFDKMRGSSDGKKRVVGIPQIMLWPALAAIPFRFVSLKVAA